MDPKPEFEAEIPNEVPYSDDVDFIGQNHADIKRFQKVITKYQPKVNADNTEYAYQKAKKGGKK